MEEHEPAPRPRCVAVVAGGPGEAPRPAVELPPDTVVIAADSGIDLALAAGYPIHHAVGDFDSVTPEGFARAEAAGAHVQRHERDKDATDLELALDLALGLGPDRLIVIGTSGGRLDHELAMPLVLVARRFWSIDVVAHLGPAVIAVVPAGRTQRWSGAVGEQVSLLPVLGPATGVATTGLRWPLNDAVLADGSTRGCSNEAIATDVSVTCTGGVLLVIRPGTCADHVPSRAAAGPADPPSPDPERSPR
ncbi:MAG: thiamine pyrophosphokinae [Acidimicrobiales bacterium]|nr:thiamine pyrophosphokinae [Acidimicrobiales bacterium]